MRAALWLVPLAVIGGGCGAGRTEMVVRIVAGDSQVLGQIDHLALLVRDVDDNTGQYQVQSTPLCAGSNLRGCITLPVDLVLFPGPQRPMDTVEVEVQGLAADTLRIDTAARFQFTSHRSSELTLALYSACLDRKPACFGQPDTPYCLPDGSCGQPGQTGSDGGMVEDLGAPDLSMGDLATLADGGEEGGVDFAVMHDLLEPDLAPCTAPVGEDAFVDVVFGTDNLAHGSGAGACAFRTVTYALAHSAPNAILHLAPNQTISSVFNPETFPLTLTGQTLSCGANTTLYGSGPVASPAQYTVELAGPGSAVLGCIVSPGFADPSCASLPPTAYVGAHVTMSGTGPKPVVIDHCQIDHSAFSIGIYVESAIDNLSITNNQIRATNDVQVGNNVTAQVNDNSLKAGCGGTTFSVRCGAVNTVEILRNTNSGGALTCNGSCYSSGGAPSGQQCL